MLKNIDELEIGNKIVAKQGQAYFDEVVMHTLIAVRGLYPSLSTFGVTEVLGKRGLSAETVNSLHQSGIGLASLVGIPMQHSMRKFELESVPNLGVVLADPMGRYPAGCPSEVALLPGTLMHHGYNYRNWLVGAARNSAWVTMAVNWNMAMPGNLIVSIQNPGTDLLQEFLWLYGLICGICGVNPAQGAENPYLFGGLGIFTDCLNISFERPIGDYCGELQEVGEAMLGAISEIPTLRRLAGELKSWLARSRGREIVFLPPPLNVSIGFRVMPDSN